MARHNFWKAICGQYRKINITSHTTQENFLCIKCKQISNFNLVFFAKLKNRMIKAEDRIRRMTGIWLSWLMSSKYWKTRNFLISSLCSLFGNTFSVLIVLFVSSSYVCLWQLYKCIQQERLKWKKVTIFFQLELHLNYNSVLGT